MMYANPVPKRADARGPRKALICAWIVEVIAVVMGLVLAAYAGFEGSDGGTIAFIVAMIPFTALSAIEFTKIPLIEVAFRVRSWKWVILALIAIPCVTGATFENFVFGFERAFNERMRAVEAAELRISQLQAARAIAEAAIPSLTERHDEAEKELARLGKEMDAIREQAEHDIGHAERRDDDTRLRDERTQLLARLKEAEQARDRAVNAENARCHRPEVHDCRLRATTENANRTPKAIQDQIAQLDERERTEHETATADEKAARDRRNLDLDGKTRQAKAVQDKLDLINRQITEARTASLEGEKSVAEAMRTRDERIDRSQIHRLADIFLGNHEPAALERTKEVVVISLAAIVAVIGTVLATMHYAALHAAEARRRPLTNAVRAYFARRRRRIPILRDIAEEARQRNRLVRSLRAWIARRRKRVVRTVIREVPVDRLKIIYLPLNPSEEAVFEARREAGRTAA